MIRECTLCSEQYDDRSKSKQLVGGLIIHCPDCSNETAIKYVSLSSSDGKANQATIVKFKSEKDKSAYMRFWQNNSGLHKGKSCQLGSHLSTTPKIEFETLVDFVPSNHKGKL
jgi:hypothetical protein